MKTLAALVFPNFELLDLFGPLEMFGFFPGQFKITIVSNTGDLIASRQGPRVAADATVHNEAVYDLILVPGGPGTPVEVENKAVAEWLIRASQSAEIVMGVCTGGALLAKVGLLDGRAATTNKNDFVWAAAFGDEVNWIAEARWVEDQKFFTSSGVSAGIDMSLAVIARIVGQELAERVALLTEYDWHQDSTWDPFAKLHNLI